MSNRLHLELLSYTDSLFTNPHDIVSHSLPLDGRGTFSHVGVRMQGLESRRHLNFRCMDASRGAFVRDASIRNDLHLRVCGGQVAVMDGMEINTAFFTHNNVAIVYSIEFLLVDLSTNTSTVTHHIERIHLSGDSVTRIDLPDGVKATDIKISCGEGGITRFHVYGELCDGHFKHKEVDILHNERSNAVIVASSDSTYGDAKLVLRQRREGSVMAGWESCRHSGVHYLIVRMPDQSCVHRIEVDTYMHVLNPFRYVCVLGANLVNDEACRELLPKCKVKSNAELKDWLSIHDLNQMCADNASTVEYEMVVGQESGLKQLIPWTAIKADTLHTFYIDANTTEFTHLFVLAVPDGGLHRFGAYGRLI